MLTVPKAKTKLGDWAQEKVYVLPDLIFPVIVPESLNGKIAPIFVLSSVRPAWPLLGQYRYLWKLQTLFIIFVCESVYIFMKIFSKIKN